MHTMNVHLLPCYFDQASGCRERLALLAAIGPTLDPSCWGYHPSGDYWYYCGGAQLRQGAVRVDVPTIGEVDAALGLIAVRHLLSRAEALAIVGYPEEAPDA